MSGKGSPYAGVVQQMVAAAQVANKPTPRLEFPAADDQTLITLMAFTCARPRSENEATDLAISKAESILSEACAAVMHQVQERINPSGAVAMLLRLAAVIAHDQGYGREEVERLAVHMLAEPGSSKRIPTAQLVELAKTFAAS